MNRLTSRSAITIFALCGVLLAACGSSSPEAEKPVSGGVLLDSVAFAAGSPDTLDPGVSNLLFTAQIDDLLFDGLTVVDERGNVKKEVASDYSTSEDGKVWTFTLRDNVKFSDGSPVLASSFKRGWERALNPAIKSNVAYHVQQIASSPDATKLDNVIADDQKRTITIKLNAPQNNIPALLSGPVFSPVPTSAVDDSSWGLSLMVANGPYKLTAPYKSGETLKVERNTLYAGNGAGKQPYLDAIEFRSFNDTDAAYKEFAAGKGDMTQFPQSAAADLQKYQKENVITPPLLAVDGFDFNVDSPIFGGAANLKLRQAIDAAIDKAQINQEAFAGTYKVASQFSPPAIDGAQPKETDGKANIEKSKRLLKEWGKTPPQIKIAYPDSFDPRLVNVAVENLKAAGFDAVAEPSPTDPYYPDAASGKYNVFFFQWFADYPTYQGMLEPMWNSQNIGSTNLSRYKNAEVDSLFAKALTTSSASESNESYRQAEQKILDDQPYVPLVWVTENLIKNSYVHDVTVDPLGKIDYSRIWLSQKTAS